MIGAAAPDGVVEILGAVEADDVEDVGPEIHERDGPVGGDRVAREEAHAIGQEPTPEQGLAAHPEHGLDAVPVAERGQGLEDRRVGHLVPGRGRLGVRVAVAVDEAVPAGEVAAIGDVHHRGGVARVLAVVAAQPGPDHRSPLGLPCQGSRNRAPPGAPPAGLPRVH